MNIKALLLSLAVVAPATCVAALCRVPQFSERTQNGPFKFRTP